MDEPFRRQKDYQLVPKVITKLYLLDSMITPYKNKD